LPDPPASALDPVLDAATRCFARHGLRRTSVQDVARELGVNRTTVYRQVGNVEDMGRLLLARELHRVLGDLPAVVDVDAGPETVVDVMATIVGFAVEHPVVVKLREVEPEVLGALLVVDLPPLLAGVATAVTPLLRPAMDAGILARRDPDVVADWLTRLALSLVAVPPLGPLRDYLAELVEPVLRP
jgi:AcrR family transcriptional regulator